MVCIQAKIVSFHRAQKTDAARLVINSLEAPLQAEHELTRKPETVLKQTMKKFIFLTLMTSTLASAAFGFDLYCRGPLLISTGPSGRMAQFKKAHIKAGTDGLTLNPGECAWADRPLRPDEPAVIYYDMTALGAEYVPPDVGDHDPLPLKYFQWVMGQQTAVNSMIELTQYYTRKDVVVSLDVINNSILLGFTSTRFPRFHLGIMPAKP